MPSVKRDTPDSDSDDDDDDDYVPTVQEVDGESSSSDSEGENGEVPTTTEEKGEKEKKDLNALWTDFEATVATASEIWDEKLVKVVRKYRFAGEEHEEIFEVPENSEDAKRWPRYKSPERASTSTAEQPVESVSTPIPEALAPAKRKPGPRKPKATLGPLPGSSKVKKVSTLEKSAMDWTAHLQAQDGALKDELEANRKSGGYLEKVDFLKRVDERKEETLDAVRSSKRRKH